MIIDGYTADNLLKIKNIEQTEESKSETYGMSKMYGWICPVCGRGLSPFTSICPCRNFESKPWEVTCKEKDGNWA